MLLKIDVKPEDILMNKKGRIVIKLHYYGAFATGANLATVKGATLEDFEDSRKVQSMKNVFVGTKGGISIG